MYLQHNLNILRNMKENDIADWETDEFSWDWSIRREDDGFYKIRRTDGSYYAPSGRRASVVSLDVAMMAYKLRMREDEITLDEALQIIKKGGAVLSRLEGAKDVVFNSRIVMIPFARIAEGSWYKAQ